jgi:hypothetical protein
MRCKKILAAVMRRWLWGWAGLVPGHGNGF